LRSVFNTGAEITWKASRVYRQAESDLLDVHGLRHVIEPSIQLRVRARSECAPASTAAVRFATAHFAPAAD